VEQYYIPLPKNVGAEARVLAVMEFDDYVVASTHLDHVSAQAREEQAKIISEEMIKRYGDSDKRVFLGGDMNCTPDSEVITIFKKDWTILTGTSGRDNYTFSTTNPKSCIDYIMLLNNGAKVDVIHRQVITALKAGDVTQASDHFPVLLEVKW
ncbi:MAG: endonuclease, partial [Alistipes sp.]|nr:endonuclease [Alistipes sp.]